MIYELTLDKYLNIRMVWRVANAIDVWVDIKSESERQIGIVVF